MLNYFFIKELRDCFDLFDDDKGGSISTNELGKLFEKLGLHLNNSQLQNMMNLMDQVNYMDQQHKFMFDKENLINILKKIQFKIVTLRDFDESLDMKSRDFESIYAIAIK